MTTTFEKVHQFLTELERQMPPRYEGGFAIHHSMFTLGRELAVQLNMPNDESKLILLDEDDLDKEPAVLVEQIKGVLEQGAVHAEVESEKGVSTEGVGLPPATKPTLPIRKR